MIQKLVKEIELHARNPQEGLPDDLFYLVGRLTPFVNVDLLIKHPIYGVLLSWRDDVHLGKGWHFPGGIVRFRENFEHRIYQVALKELGARVLNTAGPVAVNQIISHDKIERSHFISLLFSCVVDEKFIQEIIEGDQIEGNKIKFFKIKPVNLISEHEIYTQYFL
jgi:ADP-ribose pyrophosphatase YjhB (NUDIX family)